jgi:hypothetical protein
VNRIIGIVSAMLLGLLILVPVAAAADPFYQDGRVIVSVRGDITFPAGESADNVVIVDGTATIEGDVGSVFVVNGTVNFVGSQTREVIAISSNVSIDGGSVIAGDVRSISSTVTQAPGATVQGQVKAGWDWVQGAFWIGPALFIAYLGFVLAAVVAAVALAGLASRQVRSAEALFRREAGSTIVAAFAGLFGIIAVATLALVTIIGIPLGLALLVGLLPLLLFIGYLVAAIWIGEWVVGLFGSRPKAERPYLGAAVGILVMSVVSFVPFVGGLIAFVGFGAVVLLMWRIIRSEAGSSEPTNASVAAPAAG